MAIVSIDFDYDLIVCFVILILYPMQKNYDYILKFVIVGSSSVGKSSILRRFADDQFEESYISTIGIDFRFKSFYVDSSYVKLQIWDTAGQQRFRGITKSYYKGAHAVIMVYDATVPQSFDDIVTFWMKQTKQYAPEGHIYCFINKCDKGALANISAEQIAFLEQNNIKWMKVSAKKKFNISEGIMDIVRDVMTALPKTIKNPNSGISLIQNHLRKQQKRKCCQK